MIARTSSFQFKRQNSTFAPSVANSAPTTCSKEVFENLVSYWRVAAQLIDSRDGSHWYSDTYYCQTGDALKIQDEIAASLVWALQVTVMLTFLYIVVLGTWMHTICTSGDAMQ